MKVRTQVKAGALGYNRCEKRAVPPRARARASLKVRTGLRAGGLIANRCETLAR